MFIFTGEATVNNVFCEQIVDMFSWCKLRNPKCSLLYLSSKIKCTKNNTYEFLENFSEKDQDILIKKTVPLASGTKRKTKAYIHEMQTEILEKVCCKLNRKSAMEKQNIEKSLKDYVLHSGPADVLEILVQSDNIKKNVVNKILKGDVMGEYIVQVWFDKEGKKDISLGGKFEDSYTDEDACIVLIINYWTEDSTEEEGETTLMTATSIATQYLCGEINFI